MKFDDLLPVLENVPTVISSTTSTVAAAINDPTKAPGRFPYPLDTIMDDLAEAYLQLHNAKEKLGMAGTGNLALDIKQRDHLKFLRDKMALCAKEVRETASEIELKYTLDN